VLLGEIGEAEAIPVIGARYSLQGFADALDLRRQLHATAVDIWMTHPIIGYGAGNYMHGAKVFGNEFTETLPVHNISLWFAADTGIVGAIAFHGVLLAALRRYWQLIRSRSGLASRVALGAFTGLVACFLDSLTEPLLRAPTIFAIFWTLIALSVSLPSLLQGPDPICHRLLRVQA
jgi:O-antigen ligase